MYRAGASAQKEKKKMEFYGLYTENIKIKLEF